MCTYLMTKPFHWYQNFNLETLTLKFDLLLKNFNLGHSFFTRRGRAFVFHMCIYVARPSMPYHDFWPSDLDLEGCITLKNKLSWTMTFESAGSIIVAIYIWLPSGSYVVFLTTLVMSRNRLKWKWTIFIEFGKCVSNYYNFFFTFKGNSSDCF